MNYLFIITEYFVHALPLMGESYLIAYKIGKTGLHTNTYSQRKYTDIVLRFCIS